MTPVNSARRQGGFSMMEVLVTMIILLVALLGIAALQAKAQIAELEAHQRSQALILLSDIMDRMNANRETVHCFAITTNTVSGTPYIGATGPGHVGTPTCTASTSEYNTLAVSTINALNGVLQGNTERVGLQNVGGMIGARACISYDETTALPGTPDTGLYTIVVTWQGMDELVEPAAGMECAVDMYGSEAQRRAVSAQMRIAKLL
jgi:type IV pilus assembly protein PilV